MVTMPDIAQGLVNGNFHRDPRVRWLNLGFVREDFMDELRHDCFHIVERHPHTDVSMGEHITNWTQPEGHVCQWSLFNHSGKTDDTSSDFDYSNLGGKRGTSCRQGHPAITHLIDSIPDLVNLRLNGLGPQSHLSPHEEHLPRKVGRDRVGIRARFHIPILSNDRAWMLADNQVAHFQEGFLYLFNNGCVHGAGNHDLNHWRYHLVFDCVLTERLYHTLLDPEAGYANPDWLIGDMMRVSMVEQRIVTDWETDWEGSGGMGVEQFEARQFTWCQPTDKERTA